MPSMANPDATTAHAFSRFGFGGRPSDGAPGNIHTWLAAQLSAPDPLAHAQPTTSQALDLFYNVVYPATPALGIQLKAQFNAQCLAEAYNLYANAVTTPEPFRERLVWFWMNHFGLIHNRGETSITSGPFVREAIRPFVTGTFASLLGAALHHPALLFSLDNVLNVGPHSPNGVRVTKAGRPALSINQNLGRETLELFSVGVDGGYTQADVLALSNLLTGLQVYMPSAPRGYRYDPAKAEPGMQLLLGQSFDGTEAGCAAAIQMLATHPATYLHLATKLVTHFVSDTPSNADVHTIAEVLRSTGGDLGAASLAITRLANAWIPLEKVRTPSEHAIAILRAVNANAAETAVLIADVHSAINLPWGSKFANGWSDLAIDWIGPAQMEKRLWVGSVLANAVVPLRTGQTGIVASAGGASVFPFLTPAVTAAIASLKGVANQLIVLFTLPEFLRR